MISRPEDAGRWGLIAIGASAACTVAVAAAGTSVMEPPLPGRPWQPPFALNLNISPYLAVGLTAAGLAAGTVGLVLVLRAIRGGWSVPARTVLLGGLLAAAVLTLLPPFGSSDHLSYAAYGRMVVTGHNPYTTEPAQLARLGDPVARAVQDWYKTPSVYGPLASGIQGLASLLGGTSVRLTVFVLGIANLIAFAVTGLLLHRMTSGRPDRQLRAAVLWAANPLLLQVLVAGAHVDSQAIVFDVAAIAVMFGPFVPWPGGKDQKTQDQRAAERPGALAGRTFTGRAALAGALVGLGFAVKVTAALPGLGLAVGLVLASRRQRDASRPGGPDALVWPLAALGAGFAVVAGPALVIGGSAMLDQTSRASEMVSIGSPWRLIRSGLDAVLPDSAGTDVVKYGAIVLAVLLSVLVLRGRADRALADRVLADSALADSALADRELAVRPRTWRSLDGGRERGPATPEPPVLADSSLLFTAATVAAFAFALAWLFAWPYVLPWYDALAWALLPLVAVPGAEWLLLARTAVLGFGYLPARQTVTLPHGLGWLEPVIRHGITPAVLAVVTVWLVVLMRRSRREGPEGSAGIAAGTTAAGTTAAGRSAIAIDGG